MISRTWESRDSVMEGAQCLNLPIRNLQSRSYESDGVLEHHYFFAVVLYSCSVLAWLLSFSLMYRRRVIAHFLHILAISLDYSTGPI